MPKKFLEDMTPKVRREAHKKAWGEVVRTKPKVFSATPEGEAEVYKKPPKSSRYRLWPVAGVSIIFMFFSFSFLFAGATLQIGPRVEELSLDQNFSATKGVASPALSFDLVAISGEESVVVTGGEEKNVSRKAEGVVVVYNSFSSATQRLDIDTRLEGSNGKIYKTKKAIVVPGMKGNTPGAVEVGVYASEAGEAYNSGPLDFNIVGFKGTAKYAKFYARSKGDIRGGFVGKEREIAGDKKQALLDNLKNALKDKLLTKALGQIPAGFILFDQAVALEVEEENLNSQPDGNEVEVVVKGTLHGVLLEEEVLTQKIIEKNLPKESGNDIYLKDIRKLTFSFNEGNAQDIASAQSLNFNLSGKTPVVFKIDEQKLMTDILGRKKGEINQILALHQNIVSANLSLRPFWNRSLPKNPGDIKIIISYPQD